MAGGDRRKHHAIAEGFSLEIPQHKKRAQATPPAASKLLAAGGEAPGRHAVLDIPVRQGRDEPDLQFIARDVYVGNGVSKAGEMFSERALEQVRPAEHLRRSHGLTWQPSQKVDAVGLNRRV